MKSVFLFVAGAVFSASTCRASEPVNLRQVENNSGLTGLFPLDQGYLGKFTKIFNEGREPLDRNMPFEFTHARLNDTGLGGLSPRRQALVVGIKEHGKSEVEEYRSVTVYLSRIPAFEGLKKLATIKEFEEIFGPFRDATDGWGNFEGSHPEIHSSIDWMGFLPIKGGGIRVVSVFLYTLDRGKGAEIEKRDIREGVFLPTGEAPKPEIEEIPSERSEHLPDPAPPTVTPAGGPPRLP